MHNCETTDWKTIVSRVRHILLRIILAYCPILQDITRISRRTTITFPSFSSIVNLHLSKNFRIISEMESYESEIYVTSSVSVLFYYVYRQRLQNSYTYSDTKIPSKHEKTATEALLLRFCCGVTGTTFKESNERLTMLMY